ncbi:Importin-11 [Pseudolycoriella hygida]|uniref:Importin-11 n=1 Tax=Pseudolycoriella hygida TaxID=35572 RepID=A0A9Q0RXI5_9DIPT|nr:Importin-11 [Pseudolycoriella hygida]
MAAVYCKNGVSKFWRRNCQHEVNGEEKIAIKSMLLTSFREPVPQIAVQIAEVIAKIARFDCPREWPELVPTLLRAVQNTTDLEQHRALLVLHSVMKTMWSKRLPLDRKIFEQLTNTMYSFVLNLWDGFTTLYFQSLNEMQATNVSQTYIEKALLALRILRKSTTHGFYKPHWSEDCMLFIKSSFPRLKESLECRHQLKQTNYDQLTTLTEKFILKLMKILNEFLELHPLSFIDFIPAALEFSFNYVFNEGTNMIFENNELKFTNFAIHCINLMKGILSSNTYNTYTEDSLPKEVNVSDAIAAKKDFFTPVRLSYICEKIVMHYFLLTQPELEQWDDDPEAFCLDESGESWKYALKPCTEAFFLALFSQFREDMTTEMAKYIKTTQGQVLNDQSDLKSILAKDAIYNAAGLVSFNLYDEIDFDEWFTNQLVHEVKIKGNRFRIIRRRAIWLIGQWTGVKFDRQLRPQVYAACLNLIEQSEDMCVRITASKTLMTTMDDFEFDSQSFLEYLEPSFASLFTLLREAKECHTKMNVLYIMGMMIDKMSTLMTNEYADKLIQYLPLLWEESRDYNLLRCAIISILIQIVKASNHIPQHLSTFIYPVIQISTNTNEPSHVYLLEEGLELWLTLIENSIALNPELLDLSPNILSIIEQSSENLRTCLYIIQTYVLLDPPVFLERHGKAIVACCMYLLSDMRPEGVVMVLKLFELFLKTMPEYGIELLRPSLPDIFMKIVKNSEYPMVMTLHLTFMSRVLIVSQNTFFQIVQELQAPQAFQQLLDVWISKMSSVTHSEKRKLLGKIKYFFLFLDNKIIAFNPKKGLALASLLTVQNDLIYDRISSIMMNLCEVLNDIMREDEGTMYDSLIVTGEADLESNYWWNIDDADNEYNTHHYERLKKLCLSDPVHTIVLKSYIESQINLMKQQLGPERVINLLRAVDDTVLDNLAEHISIPLKSEQ